MILETEKPWPNNAWYQAAWAHEIENKPFKRTILNEAVVLFRDGDGRARALEDRCCHRAAPLSMGEVIEEGLQCPYHGMVFDGDGICVRVPGQDRIADKTRVRSYPIVERQEFIWIWMGDPALADPSEIVDYPWNDDYENWPHTHGMYYIKCNYMLLVDNLMDLTHIPFVHVKTIGGGSKMGQVDATMDVEPTPKGVHFVRWMMNITPPPTYVKGAGFADGVKVDRWQDFEYIAPSSVLLWTGAHEVGRNAKEDRDQPGGFKHRVYHGVTPETESTCFYFWAPSNGYKTDDPEATKILHAEIAATFAEDVEILEAQQAVIERTRGQPMVNTKHDVARVPARRAIERMIEAETPPKQAAE